MKLSLFLALAGACVDSAGAQLRFGGNLVPALSGDRFELILDRELLSGAGDIAMRRELRRLKLPAGATQFAFTGLAPGRYQIKVCSARHAYEERQFLLLQDRTGLRLDLRPAATLDVNVGLGFDGAVEGVRVWLLSAAPAPHDVQRDATADAAGRCTLWNLAPGDHVALVRWQRGAWPEVESVERRFAVRLAPRRQSVMWRLEPDADVAVRVAPSEEHATGRGQIVVVDEAGTEVVRQGYASPSEAWIEVPGVPAGSTYRLTVAQLGAAPEVRTVRADGDPVRLAVAPRALPGQRLHLASPPAARFWQVLAQPVANPGAPFEQILWGDDRSPLSHAPARGDAWAYLPPGRWRLRFASDQSVPVEREVVVGGSGDRALAFPFEPGAALVGQLRAAAGDGIGGVVVYLFERSAADELLPRPTHQTATDADGGFRWAGLAPGRYRIGLGPEAAAARADFTVPAEAESGRLDVTLDPGGALRAAVVTSPR